MLQSLGFVLLMICFLKALIVECLECFLLRTVWCCSSVLHLWFLFKKSLSHQAWETCYSPSTWEAKGKAEEPWGTGQPGLQRDYLEATWQYFFLYIRVSCCVNFFKRDQSTIIHWLGIRRHLLMSESVLSMTRSIAFAIRTLHMLLSVSVIVVIFKNRN